MNEIAIGELRKKLEITQKEKDDIQLNLEKFENASKSLNQLIECQIVDNCKKELGYENYNAVPPPYTGNFMPLTPDLYFTSLDEFVNKPVAKNVNAKSSEEEGKVVRKNNDAPFIKDWVSDNKEENKQFQNQRMVKHVWNNAQRVNHKNFAKKIHPCAKKNIVSRAVPMKSGLVSVNTARQVNAAHSKTTMNAARSMSYLSKTAHLTAKRLGHLNFKTMNNLVKGNLVRGLPSKLLKMIKPVLLVKRESSTEPLAEAINTVCYVQNRVLVVKPHNKTPYELFHGRTPILSFMRPFTCPVTILNTIDHLGKFDGKADEGFFVGYSLNSKALRVFNSRTKIVEENLHIRFSENTPNAKNDTLFQKLLKKRRKHFAAKRTEEKRNKPPIQAQKRKLMCTYLKNMEGYKLKLLKSFELDKI
nr:retrovirus-related Pol polyprotein from transposon TNT 1-94 [Tanacetum cinerariifolium]